MRRAEGYIGTKRPLLTSLRVGKKGSEKMGQGHRGCDAPQDLRGSHPETLLEGDSYDGCPILMGPSQNLQHTYKPWA